MCQAKLVVNWKNGNDVTIFHHDVIVNFFLSLFSYWSRNPEIGNTPV